MRFICLLLVSLAFNTVYGQNKDLTESMKQGKMVYDDFCITCHMGNGEGLLGTFPPLAKSDFLMKNRAKRHEIQWCYG
jgi:mono/diheme cytochrome c family protein